VTPPIADREARARAVGRFDTNLVVVAGAGTGKTGLLVERFLNLVLSERVPLEGIVALTFTEKAATEMKGRVRAALDDLADGVSPLAGEAARSHRWLTGAAALPEPEIAARAAAFRERLDRAFVGTIHGFCADLLRRHPMEAGLPPEVTVDEGGTHDLVFEAEWPAFLARELGPEPRKPDLWRDTLERFTEAEIEAVARSLVRCPEACDSLDRVDYRSLDAVEMFGEEATALRDDLVAARAHMLSDKKLARNAALAIDTQILLLSAFLEGGPEAMRAVGDLPAEHYWKRKDPLTPVLEPGFTDDKEAIKARSKDAITLLRKLRELHDHAFPVLMEALRPFAQRFRRRVHEDGVLSYTDLLLLARNLLARNPAVRRAEAARARALLVDEFQDTDPLQYEIVFLLAARGEGAIENPYTVPLEPGRLFIVGDPKQSIYRFRGADMAAYHRATEHVLREGSGESLVTNFRSRPGILAPLNRLFEDWIGNPRNPGVEPEYEAIAPHRDAGDGPAVEVWSVLTPPKTTAGDRRREEARHLAAWIRKETGPEGRLEWGNIALLYRAMSDIPIYARAFREAGIPFVVDGGKAFAERPEVVEAFALLRAIANPADPVATLGVLRSTLGAVPDARLLEYKRAGGVFNWTRNPDRLPEGFPEIRAAFDLLRRMDRDRRSLPLDRWIQKTLTESEFALLMAAYFEGAQRVANVRKLAERASALARTRGLTLEETIDALEEEFTGSRAEGDSPLADEVTDAVRILTIHKAKGLEYDVVILPDLARGNPPGERETRVSVTWTPPGPRIAVRLIERNKMRNSASLLAEREAKNHEEAEVKRLLYVATTRAKERLILVNSSRKGKQRWLEAMARAWDYHRDAEANDPYPPDDVDLVPGVRHRLLCAAPPPAGAPPAAVDPSGWLRAFGEAATLAATEPPPRFRSPSDDHRTRRTEDASGGVPRDRNTARGVGTAVHRALEGCRFPDPPGEAVVAGAAAAAARELNLDPDAILREAEAVLRGFFASELPGYLAGVEILGREVPILYRDPDGVTVHGYADLIYRRGGRIHVADYKTDEETSPEHAEGYRGQLADYGEAVRLGLGLGEPPATEVLFVRTGTRIPFAPEEAPR